MEDSNFNPPATRSLMTLEYNDRLWENTLDPVKVDRFDDELWGFFSKNVRRLQDRTLVFPFSASCLSLSLFLSSLFTNPNLPPLLTLFDSCPCKFSQSSLLVFSGVLPSNRFCSSLPFVRGHGAREFSGWEWKMKL